MKQKRILVVSYGTAVPEAIISSIEPIEKAIATAFPDCDIYRAFSGAKIREILKSKYDMEIDSSSAALENAVRDGVSQVVILPTHLSGGIEYAALVKEAERFSSSFEKMVICPTITDTDEDIEKLADIFIRKTSALPSDTAALYIGHGTEAGNDIYGKLWKAIRSKGIYNIYITTLSDGDKKEMIAKEILNDGYESCVLLPLLMVTGRHASTDIGGSAPDSWLSEFNTLGLIAEYRDEGLGGLPEVHELFVEKIIQ